MPCTTNKRLECVKTPDWIKINHSVVESFCLALPALGDPHDSAKPGDATNNKSFKASTATTHPS